MKTAEIIDSIPEHIKSLLDNQQLVQLAQSMKDKEQIIIIAGPQGPTGKTTLANYLKSQGYKAYEEWEVQKFYLNKKLI